LLLWRFQKSRPLSEQVATTLTSQLQWTC